MGPSSSLEPIPIPNPTQPAERPSTTHEFRDAWSRCGVGYGSFLLKDADLVLGGRGGRGGRGLLQLLK